MTDQDDPKFLAWIDLETTGLSMSEDYIVEWALLVTDFDLDRKFQRIESSVIQHGDAVKVLRRIKEQPIVKKMHTENGLIAELESGIGMTLRRSEKTICETLGRYGEPGDFLIAGSGVAQFDQPWIRHFMPSVDLFFRYSPFDIGSVRRFVELTLKRPDLILQDKKVHRAPVDVEFALSQARAFKEIFKDIVRPGSDEEM